MNDITTTTAGTPAEWQSKLDLVKSMVAKGCSQDEFDLLCHLARTYHLDPLAKEIWSIKYGNNPATIFVGHAGLINLALRSGKLDGLQCEIIDPNGDDPVARATVWRNDMTHPIVAEVYWSEYGKDAKNPLWRTKPRTMLRKTAEVHALRRAFALSGLYTEEEMDHVPREIPDTSRPVSTIAEPKAMTKTQPAEICHNPDAGPVLRCDVCGRGTDEYPALPIRERDGQMVCGPCQRKAEKAMGEAQVTHVVEPAPAPKTVPKPAAKVPKPAPSGAVCSECGKALEASEEKTSLMFMSRPLCKGCLQHATGPQPGEVGPA